MMISTIGNVLVQNIYQGLQIKCKGERKWAKTASKCVTNMACILLHFLKLWLKIYEFRLKEQALYYKIEHTMTKE